MSNPSAPLAADGRTSLLWNQNGSANTVDEALNQREFEAARQQWLNSGDQKQQTRDRSAGGIQQKTITSSSSTAKKKVPDRADLLLKETKKMDARLAILRASMEAEKGKRQAATTASPAAKQQLRVKRASNPASLAPSSASMALTGTSTGSLAATLIAPSLASNKPAASASAAYKHVAPRVDMQNTFLQVKETVEREKREARAKAVREKEAETKRLAELKAKGHTLLTYAAAEPTQKWILHREEDEVAAREAAISDVGVSLRGAPAAGSVRTGPRKAVTAADMMRMKRASSASKEHSSQAAKIPSGTSSSPHTIAPSASSAIPAASTSSSTVIDRTRFNLMPTPTAITTSTETTTGSSLLDGDFDETANAAEFAAAREEFLRSLQPAEPAEDALEATQKLSSLSPATFDSTSSDSTSLPTASSFEPSSSALPTNWWERSESEEAEANASAAPGSLLDGPAFDETDSAAAFQAARQQWMAQEQGNSTNINSPQSTNEVSKPISNSNNAAAVAAPTKASCYTCYKQFFTKEGGVQCEETQRWYCTEACLASDQAQRIEKCAGCSKKIRRKDAKQRAQGWLCERCVSESDAAAPISDAVVDSAPVQPDASTTFAAEEEEPLVELFGAASFTASLAAREWKPKETKTVKFATPATPELRAGPNVDLADSELSAWGDQ